jgi:hypothetical protein
LCAALLFESNVTPKNEFLEAPTPTTHSQDVAAPHPPQEAPLKHHPTHRFFHRLLLALGLFSLLCSVLCLTACGSSDDEAASSPPPAAAASAAVSGVILASSSSEPVANAKVSSGNSTAQTAADGSFTLQNVSAGETAVLRVQAAGYVDGFLSVSPTASTGAAKRHSVRLVRAANAVVVDAAAANTVTVPNSTAQVALPANGLVNAAGAPVSGKVSVQITPINPAADPLSMPGNYTTSANQRIESFGAINVVLKDASGAALNLKTGSSATIRIALSSLSADTPASIPLFYLNEATGLWVQEGTATLAGTAPNQYYEGVVTHFSTWNADRVQDTIYVNGCVNDAAGKPLVDAEVSSVGIDYSGSARDTTNTEGKFRVAIRKAGRASIFADSGNVSNTVVAGPSGVDITLPACLVVNGAPVAPTVLEQPTNVVTPPSGFAFFRVVATGTRPLKYQWKRGGVPIAGQTYDYLFLLGDELVAGNYSVTITNPAGSVTSAVATLTLAVVTPVAPTIVVQPVNASAPIGGTATFLAFATAEPAPSYQWQRNGVAIAGATSASYTTPAVTQADIGATYSVVVRNTLGSITSNAATLTLGSAAVGGDKENLLRMVNLSFNFYYASASPLSFIADGQTFANPSTVCQSGTASATLNGNPVAANQAVPTTGTLAATFADCTSNGRTYSGSSSVVYALDSFLATNGTSTTTANNMRVRLNAGPTVVDDVTANGVGTLTYRTTVGATDTTSNLQLTQSPGATLRNNATGGLTATFNSGSVTLKTVMANNASTAKQVAYTYDNLTFTVDGVSYVAQGSYQYDFSPALTGSGEVVLSSKGQRIGRIFFDANGVFSIEVDGVVKPFNATLGNAARR